MATKRENYEAIKEVLVNGGYEELADFVGAEIERLVAKSGQVSKKTLEKRAQNAELTEVLYTCVGLEPARLSDIAMGNEALADLSTSKLAYLMKSLVDSGRVKKTYDGRVATYQLATE